MILLIVILQRLYNFVTFTINLLAASAMAPVIPVPTPARVNVTPVVVFVLILSAETPPDNCVAVLLMITLLVSLEKNKLVATGDAETEAVV